METPKLMVEELYNAAVEGDITLFLNETKYINTRETDTYSIYQTTPTGNNIIHIAAEHNKYMFISEVLALFPDLGRSKNSNKDSPLHFAARKGNEKVVNLLISYNGCATEEESMAKETWPWMAKNLQGDTPLHLALSNKKLGVAMELLKVGAPMLSVVNSSKETPLHVSIRSCTGTHTIATAQLEEGVLNLQDLYKGPITSGEFPPRLSMVDILKGLLIYKPATCIRDNKGSTPLHIAAQRGCLHAVHIIINHCPQSADICNSKGKTVLHLLKNSPLESNGWVSEGNSSSEASSTRYEELKKLMNIHEINAIKDRQDSFGNTPANAAMKRGDFVLVRVLIESFVDLTIKNKKGLSALDLMMSSPDFPIKMEQVIVTEAIMGEPMDMKLIDTIINGDDTNLFAIKGQKQDEGGSDEVIYDDDYFLNRTSEGLSILHLAAMCGHLKLIEKTIQMFPALVFATDSRGETSLHCAVRLEKNNSVSTKLLELAKKHVDQLANKSGDRFLHSFPWRLKNSLGNTPLHEALRSSNYEMAISLLRLDSTLSDMLNRAGETPLHILARYGIYSSSNKLMDLIKLLLGQNCTPAYTYDKDGFTPLLRAAQCGRIRVAYYIIWKCNASAQFRDSNGRTFLHHLRIVPTAEADVTTNQGFYAYNGITAFRGVRSLLTAQDNEGNTPLHFALKSESYGAAKFFLLCCVESDARKVVNIVDNEGRTVAFLIAALSDDIPYVKDLKQLVGRTQISVKQMALGKKMMGDDVYDAAVQGDMDLLGNDDDQSTSVEDEDTNMQNSEDHQTIVIEGEGTNQEPQQNNANNDQNGSSEMQEGDIELDYELDSAVTGHGKNVLHIAILHSREALVLEIIKNYPNLMFETDVNEENPLHIAAKFYKADFLKLLQHVYDYCIKEAYDFFQNPESLKNPEYLRMPFITPTRAKNSLGNTPLHEALQSANVTAQLALMHFDPEVTQVVNDAGETPLHAYCNRGFYSILEEKLTVLELLISKNKFAIYQRDNEGLTPLLRAAKTGRVKAALTILKQCPQSIQVQDREGRSFLHLLRVTGADFDDSTDYKFILEEFYKPIYDEVQGIDVFRTAQDFNGNTPMHFAIKDGNSAGAKLLAKRLIDIEGDKGIEAVGVQLYLRNKQGQSVLDLIASHDDAPNEVQKLLLKRAGLKTVGVRSWYGVCKSQIKEMANTLSVVAALLTTLTFAAAFQVPGGYEDGGTPILLRHTAFQVFMISNTIAMCGSMAVLFSLLWVMVTGNISDSFMLLDLSVSLLLLSFEATLLAFMTGVYVAISGKVLWLAILICALCSTIIVLMRKQIILHITRLLRIILPFLFNYKTLTMNKFYVEAFDNIDRHNKATINCQP